MIKVLERPALTVVGMAIHTQPRSAEIPALWPKFVARMSEIQDLQEPLVSYGVMQYRQGAPAPVFYMAAVFNRLLPSPEYQQAAGPYFERYDEEFDPGNPASIVEIYLPVRARTPGR